MDTLNISKNICSKHLQEPLSMFCNSCNALICARCIKQHSLHLVVHVSEMSQIINEYLNEKKKPLEDKNIKLKNLKEKFETLLNYEKNLNDLFLKECNDIVENIDKALNDTIKKHTDSLLMKDEINKNNNELQEQFQANEKQLNKFKEFNASIGEEIHKNNYSALCIKKADLMKTISTPIDSKDMQSNLNNISKIIQKEFSSIMQYKDKINNLRNEIITTLKQIKLDNKTRFNEGQHSKILYYDYDDEDNIIYICDLENLNLKIAKSNLPIPAYSSFCQVNNNLHILGGFDKNLKKELINHFLYNYKNNQMTQQKPMLNPKKDHTAIALGAESFIVIGGFRNKSLLSECERYFTEEEKWIQMANLNEPKQEVSLCTLQNYIYTFGGILSTPQNKNYKPETPSANHVIERLNLNDPHSQWEICNINYSDTEISLKSVNLISAFAFNEKDILIIGGNELSSNERKDILVFNIDTRDIKKFEKELLKMDTFNQVISCPIYFNESLFIMGFDDDLHCISFKNKEVKLIQKNTWQKIEEKMSET